MAKPRVRLLRRHEPGVLPHGPELAAIHRGMDAARVGKRARRAELARRIRPVRPILGTVHRLAVAHLAPTAASAERIRAAKATSSLLPITNGVGRWKLSRTMSRIRPAPSGGRPPGLSTPHASGAAPYSTRALSWG